MLLQPLQLFPVNLLHIAFFTLTSVGALLIWNSKVYRSLALFFIYQSILMLLNFIEETRIVNVSYLITPALTLLVGPLLYLFVRSLVHDQDLKVGEKLFHFLPVVLALPFTQYTQIIIAVGSTSQLVYLALSFKLLYRYHNASKAFSSEAESMTLLWIVKALMVVAVIVITDLIRLNLQTNSYLSIESKMAWYFMDTFVLLCVSLFLLFKAISKPKLFMGMVSYEKLLQKTKSENDYEDLSTAQSIFQSLEKLIKGEELFKQQRLSITDVANKSGLNVKDLSWAINLGAEKNFCEYINTLRVRYLKDQINTGTYGSLTLLDMAFEAGFGSKSTFNTVFKREVGMTPSQYLKKVNLNKLKVQ